MPGFNNLPYAPSSPMYPLCGKGYDNFAPSRMNAMNSDLFGNQAHLGNSPIVMMNDGSSSTDGHVRVPIAENLVPCADGSNSFLGGAVLPADHLKPFTNAVLLGDNHEILKDLYRDKFVGDNSPNYIQSDSSVTSYIPHTSKDVLGELTPCATDGGIFGIVESNVPSFAKDIANYEYGSLPSSDSPYVANTLIIGGSSNAGPFTQHPVGSPYHDGAIEFGPASRMPGFNNLPYAPSSPMYAPCDKGYDNFAPSRMNAMNSDLFGNQAHLGNSPIVMMNDGSSSTDGYVRVPVAENLVPCADGSNSFIGGAVSTADHLKPFTNAVLLGDNHEILKDLYRDKFVGDNSPNYIQSDSSVTSYIPHTSKDVLGELTPCATDGGIFGIGESNVPSFAKDIANYEYGSLPSSDSPDVANTLIIGGSSNAGSFTQHPVGSPYHDGAIGFGPASRMPGFNNLPYAPSSPMYAPCGKGYDNFAPSRMNAMNSDLFGNQAHLGNSPIVMMNDGSSSTDGHVRVPIAENLVPCADGSNSFLGGAVLPADHLKPFTNAVLLGDNQEILKDLYRDKFVGDNSPNYIQSDSSVTSYIPHTSKDVLGELTPCATDGGIFGIGGSNVPSFAKDIANYEYGSLPSSDSPDVANTLIIGGSSNAGPFTQHPVGSPYHDGAIGFGPASRMPGFNNLPYAPSSPMYAPCGKGYDNFAPSRMNAMNSDLFGNQAHLGNSPIVMMNDGSSSTDGHVRVPIAENLVPCADGSNSFLGGAVSTADHLKPFTNAVLLGDNHEILKDLYRDKFVGDNSPNYIQSHSSVTSYIPHTSKDVLGELTPCATDGGIFGIGESNVPSFAKDIANYEYGSLPSSDSPDVANTLIIGGSSNAGPFTQQPVGAPYHDGAIGFEPASRMAGFNNLPYAPSSPMYVPCGKGYDNFAPSRMNAMNSDLFGNQAHLGNSPIVMMNDGSSSTDGHVRVPIAENLVPCADGSNSFLGGAVLPADHLKPFTNAVLLGDNHEILKDLYRDKFVGDNSPNYIQSDSSVTSYIPHTSKDVSGELTPCATDRGIFGIGESNVPSFANDIANYEYGSLPSSDSPDVANTLIIGGSSNAGPFTQQPVGSPYHDGAIGFGPASRMPGFNNLPYAPSSPMYAPCGKGYDNFGPSRMNAMNSDLFGNQAHLGNSPIVMMNDGSSSTDGYVRVPVAENLVPCADGSNSFLGGAVSTSDHLKPFTNAVLLGDNHEILKDLYRDKFVGDNSPNYIQSDSSVTSYIPHTSKDVLGELTPCTTGGGIFGIGESNVPSFAKDIANYEYGSLPSSDSPDVANTLIIGGSSNAGPFTQHPVGSPYHDGAIGFGPASRMPGFNNLPYAPSSPMYAPCGKGYDNFGPSRMNAMNSDLFGNQAHLGNSPIVMMNDGSSSTDGYVRVPVAENLVPCADGSNSFLGGAVSTADHLKPFTNAVLLGDNHEILKDLYRDKFVGDNSPNYIQSDSSVTSYIPHTSKDVLGELTPCATDGGIFGIGESNVPSFAKDIANYEYGSLPSSDSPDVANTLIIGGSSNAGPFTQHPVGSPYHDGAIGFGPASRMPGFNNLPYAPSSPMYAPCGKGYDNFAPSRMNAMNSDLFGNQAHLGNSPIVMMNDGSSSTDGHVRVPIAENLVPCADGSNSFLGGAVLPADHLKPFTNAVLLGDNHEILKDLYRDKFVGDNSPNYIQSDSSVTSYIPHTSKDVLGELTPCATDGVIFGIGEANDIARYNHAPTFDNDVSSHTTSSLYADIVTPPEQIVEDKLVKFSSDLNEYSSVPISNVCPGVIYLDGKSECTEGFAFDGTKCVPVEDCPCINRDIRRKSGSIWKEENGCVNCICISGHAKCSPQVCEIISCEAGYVLFQAEDTCCPTCVKLDVTCLEGTKKVGEVWSEDCQTCVCTQVGIECSPMECPASVVPVCENGYQLVQKVGGCCPAQECVCDMNLCKNVVPDCPEHYKAIPVTSDGACCPEYQCVCQPESCPSTFCESNEMKVYKGTDSCCSTYTCERSGCLDTAGGWRNVGDVFTCPQNSCTKCTCTAHNVLSCSSVSCPASEITQCASGASPTEMLSEDGCCSTYTCDCYCGGIDLSWNTFDEKYISSGDLGTALLVEDSTTKEFKIYITKMKCGALACVDYLELHDNVGSNVLKMTSDGKIYIDGAEVHVETSGTLRKKGFRITKDINNKLAVNMLSTEIHCTLSEGGRAWSVTAPSNYRGRTAGLCGLCDGVKDNDLWDGFQVVSTPAEFISSFGVNLEENVIDVPDISTVSYEISQACYQHLDIFASCPVSKNLYVEACIIDLSKGGSACDVYAELASACRVAGHCIEWRTGSHCPYTCPSNMEYRACGSSTLRTCQNYKEFNTVEATFDVEGCFCSDDMVSIDGVCSKSIECPVYTDEIGVTHCAGDIWISHSDACTVVTTTSDGTLVQTPVVCPEEKKCADGETQVQVGADECCTTYECIPSEKCQDVTCPVYDVFTCAAGEEVQAIVHDECCVEMTCVCNKNTCPVLPDPTCEEGEVLVTKSSECCSTKVCECHANTCTVPTCTGEGYHLSLVSSGRCCPVYECICDRSYCSETVMPTCAPGETAQPKRTSECCVVYECVCDESTCPSAIEYCPTGYKVKKTIVEDACCKEIVECECDETACPAALDISCDATAGYKLITTITPRFAYSLPSCCPVQYERICVCDSSLCPVVKEPVCGKYESVVYEQTSACCTTPQCACDLHKCDSGSTWCPTNKHATVSLVDNCCEEVVCECNKCEAPIECKAGWVVKDVKDDCDCIIRTCEAPKHCVYNGETHEPGSSWTEDLCVECTCSSTTNSLGEYESECRDIKCGTCSSGFTYVPVAGSCCGDCVPITCHHDGAQYAVGQSWAQDDNLCTTCTCEMNPDTGEVYTTCLDTTCPPIDPSCPADKILTTPDGCCTYCDPTRTIPTECSPMPLLASYLEYEGCSSDEKVTLSTCTGSCVSTSTFSLESGNFTKSCSCCTAVDSKEVEVNLKCPDGSVITKTYKSATECQCHASVCVEP
ncbi:uncharacterized protein LOC144421988 [Styela clava]